MTKRSDSNRKTPTSWSCTQGGVGGDGQSRTRIQSSPESNIHYPLSTIHSFLSKIWKQRVSCMCDKGSSSSIQDSPEPLFIKSKRSNGKWLLTKGKLISHQQFPSFNCVTEGGSMSFKAIRASTVTSSDLGGCGNGGWWWWWRPAQTLC